MANTDDAMVVNKLRRHGVIPHDQHRLAIIRELFAFFLLHTPYQVMGLTILNFSLSFQIPKSK